ncbi:hypothetical protein [Streptomyces indicus]|uniref:hypothetical protein n=1 Tax=Streptomyces indicus TaxID=417292 RepID=UPI00115FC260|nr:hypothetical protein [Streptomyces indicus]
MYRQTVVDLDATEEQAEEWGGRGWRWLLDEGFIRAEPWRGDVVHLGGPNWREAVDLAAWDWRARAEGFDPEPCGAVELITGRTVFLAGPYDPPSAICPHCGNATADWPMAAVDAWHSTGAAAFSCRTCAREVPLPDWTWTDDYFAFAHVGFQFEDWPRLSPAFTTAFAEALGHRVRFLHGTW